MGVTVRGYVALFLAVMEGRFAPFFLFAWEWGGGGKRLNNIINYCALV